MKTKEFLSSRNVEFEAIDVANDVDGMMAMLALGVARPPVVQMGDRFVRGGVLDEVAAMLGVEPTGHVVLPPAELHARLDTILAAAQRYIRALPNDKLGLTVPKREKRNLRELSYHIFAIPIDCIEVEDGAEYSQGNGPIPEAVTTTEDIAAYGTQVRKRMDEWFAAQTDATWETIRSTTYGTHSMHVYYERATWHAAQHSRQLAAMLESAGVTVPDKLPETFFAGLPLPERLWE